MSNTTDLNSLIDASEDLFNNLNFELTAENISSVFSGQTQPNDNVDNVQIQTSYTTPQETNTQTKRGQKRTNEQVYSSTTLPTTYVFPSYGQFVIQQNIGGQQILTPSGTTSQLFPLPRLAPALNTQFQNNINSTQNTIFQNTQILRPLPVQQSVPPTKNVIDCSPRAGGKVS